MYSPNINLETGYANNFLVLQEVQILGRIVYLRYEDSGILVGKLAVNKDVFPFEARTERVAKILSDSLGANKDIVLSGRIENKVFVVKEIINEKAY